MSGDVVTRDEIEQAHNLALQLLQREDSYSNVTGVTLARGFLALYTLLLEMQEVTGPPQPGDMATTAIIRRILPLQQTWTAYDFRRHLPNHSPREILNALGGLKRHGVLRTRGYGKYEVVAERDEVRDKTKLATIADIAQQAYAGEDTEISQAMRQILQELDVTVPPLTTPEEER